MEWIRDWIMQIAGVIVLSAICEVIMPNGEMKKYVRPVIGLVLVFAVIKPVLGFSAERPDFPRAGETQRQAAELQKNLDETKRREVVSIYSEKLCRNIENELKSGGVKSDVSVSAEIDGENGDSFGEIVSVTVEGDEKIAEEAALIKQIIKREFGVNAENIRIVS